MLLVQEVWDRVAVVTVDGEAIHIRVINSMFSELFVVDNYPRYKDTTVILFRLTFSFHPV